MTPTTVPTWNRPSDDVIVVFEYPSQTEIDGDGSWAKPIDIAPGRVIECLVLNLPPQECYMIWSVDWVPHVRDVLTWAPKRGHVWTTNMTYDRKSPHPVGAPFEYRGRFAWREPGWFTLRLTLVGPPYSRSYPSYQAWMPQRRVIWRAELEFSVMPPLRPEEIPLWPTSSLTTPR